MTIDLPTIAGYSVRADKQRLKQVLLNLVGNAIKYNREQGSVRVHGESAPPHRFRIHVQDTGMGIPEDKQHRLFTPFDRLGAESTSIEGSGLGLVLSRRLTEIMGGTLSLVSEMGGGSTFTVELARPSRSLPPQIKPCKPSANEAVPVSDRTLLYIEDNATNLRLIEAVLAHRPGVRLLTATHGDVGLALARQHHPDLILLDVHLPDTHGQALMATIQADAVLSAIPVIVISADATADQIERLRRAGAKEYLTKPIDLELFLQVLDRYLR